RLDDRFIRRARRSGVDAPRRKRAKLLRRVRTVNHRPAHRDDFRMPRGLEGDLRADAGRITGGDGGKRAGHKNKYFDVRALSIEVRGAVARRPGRYRSRSGSPPDFSAPTGLLSSTGLLSPHGTLAPPDFVALRTS